MSYIPISDLPFVPSQFESFQTSFNPRPQSIELANGGSSMESLASSSHEFMIHHQATYDTPSSHSFDSQQVQSLQPVHRNLVHHPPAAEMDSSFARGPTTELTVNHTFINGMVNCTNAHPVDFSQGFNCFPSPEPVIATPIHAPNPSATNMNLEHQLSAWPHDTLGNRTVSPIDHYVYDFASSADRISSECPMNLTGVHCSPPAGTLQQERSPGNFSRLTFVMEDGIRPARHRESRVQTKEESGERREKNKRLKEMGGVCLWCYRLKKTCEPQLPCPRCQDSKSNCIRRPAELSLLPCQDMNQGSISFQTKSEDILSPLQKISQCASSQAVVSFCQCNGEVIDYWVMHAANLGATNMNTSSGLGQQLILKLLKCVQSAEMDKFETEFPGSSLVQTAVTMHKLLSAILCLSKTQVYLRASDVEQTRIVVSFMLALCRQCLCELSDDLGSEAYSLIKQKSDYDGEPAGMKNDCSGASCVNPVWVAVGLYHRVLEALSSFELPPPIADIFDKVKIRSNMVLSNIYCVKEKIAHVFGSKLEKEKLEAEKVSFEQYIPPVSCRRYFNVAICFGPFDQSQPSTAIHRQTYQSSDVSYDAEFLLKESFEPPTRASPILESQPQDMMDGADYWENLEAELSQIHPFDEGLTDFEALENALTGDWSKPSPTDSWSGTTLVNSVYCSLVGSY
ncbi:hypothetical protein KXV89_006573 [Aspergillus fumigatus]|nr:hypothetical protein KXX59_006808 [Aspergillus fumigatus]KAH1959563.1 hypothetical protein KXV90_006792 [Aspergillus fumigatus]KAH2160217.1 hypothetical protein KXW33_005123 [Aspergillus fumigatus]KAH2278274.1 hypothetical protein KXW96_000717 [Aspergillus fumigatus]KAH2335900.1 hypothetical protein KXW87_007486 [Aspergillus fumigatus]